MVPDSEYASERFRPLFSTADGVATDDEPLEVAPILSDKPVVATMLSVIGWPNSLT